MSFWTAIVWIVAIFAVASVLRARVKTKVSITEDFQGNETISAPASAESKRDVAAEQEIAELKERIAVLERIATDNNSVDASETARIAREIEALRSPEPAPPARQP